MLPNYFCYMLRKLAIVIGVFCAVESQAQVESSLALMQDSLKWLNHCTTLIRDIKAGQEDSIIKTTEFKPAKITSQIDLNLFDHVYTSEFAPPIDLNLKNHQDSVSTIPGYLVDKRWNTKSIHDVAPIQWASDSLSFQMIVDSCDFTFPTLYPRITSPFGPRWGRNHQGLDLALRTGEPVKAAFEGMVRISHFSSSYGNVVVIRHKNGLETLYAHMEARFVRPGQWIQTGQIVGLGGNTGRSYGSHLHFEIRYLGNAIDPALVVDVSKAKLKNSIFYLTKRNTRKPEVKKVENPERTNGERKDKKGKKDKKSKNEKGNKYHTVKKGETLYSISRKTGVSVSQLCKLNKIRPSSSLRVGQKLRLK
jgi:murein DD-endopeptidase MepM/ murein hydrolase activator NlpD